ncbi:adenylosuccinate lyase [Nocardia sp. NPDC058640]|uniref:adenylosuccinate lyase n=1 Tax=Nocardia sp. NPDC058640 TaxID=3346571 RepID=UPI003665A78F
MGGSRLVLARYARPEMARLWTDTEKFASWARVEILVCEAWSEIGTIPADVVSIIRGSPVPSPERVAQYEKERDHELLAFLAAYTEGMPSIASRWLHFGVTSYDIVDTALGRTLADACDLLIAASEQLRSALARRAIEHWDTLCVARTHGVHAEPTTFGHKMAGIAAAVDRSVRRLAAARAAIAVGTISGPVGTYSSVDPRVESFVCERLSLRPELFPSQVVARDRHAEVLNAVAVLGAVVEQLGLELRLLQRTEVREIEEPRTAAYQGSSAMPHKRNPTTSERICGLARLLRANAGAALENVAMWHERDLAHSSVERITLPDSLTIAHFQVHTAIEVIDGMRVFPEKMLENLNSTNGLIYSAPIMLEMVANGSDRDSSYRAVQAASLESWESGRHLHEILRERNVTVAATTFDHQAFLGSRTELRARLEEFIHVEY